MPRYAIVWTRDTIESTRIVVEAENIEQAIQDSYNIATLGKTVDGKTTFPVWDDWAGQPYIPDPSCAAETTDDPVTP